MKKIVIAGIGPGSPDYVTPAARMAVEKCSLLVGGRRNLELFKDVDTENYVFENGMEAMADYIQSRKDEKDICVVVSGDPGFYSLLDFFIRRFGSDRLSVIPGISSFQYLFSKLAMPWKDYILASMHGRELELRELLDRSKGIFLLTDKKNTPSSVASKLLDWGYSNYEMIVGENLSYPEERIVKGKPVDIERCIFNELCVVVIEK